MKIPLTIRRSVFRLINAKIWSLPVGIQRACGFIMNIYFRHHCYVFYANASKKQEIVFNKLGIIRKA